MTMNKTCEEVIILLAVHDIIDNIVNRQNLCIHEGTCDVTIQPTTRVHQNYFLIHLLDLLSVTDADKDAPVASTGYLDAITKISEIPKIGDGITMGSLRSAVAEFNLWLDTTCLTKQPIWFPTIDKSIEVKITRREVIKICGNCSKHNYLRLVRMAKYLNKILSRSNVTLGIDDAMLALGDFHSVYFDDAVNYHISTISEFLNRIRIGIHKYISPIRDKYLIKCGDMAERYSYPNEINEDYAKACYWELMNKARSGPILPEFTVPSILKLRH